jgi:Ohr subfamily peroxiredoxin
MKKRLFETTIINTGGRTGKSYSPDHSFSVDIAPDRAISGVETTATNPEQLFAAGYSACFHSALQSVFRRNNVVVESSEVAASVSLFLEPVEHSYSIGVKIRATIKGIPWEEAKKWVELAHTVCPYSKAVHGNIDVQLEVL